MFAGPLTAATEARPRSGASAAATRPSSAKTAAISPDGGSDCIRRARSATSAQPLFQRKRAREARRRILADAVPEDEVGFDAPRSPQLGESVFEREERGLRVSRLVELRRRLHLAVENREQRAFEDGAEDFVAPFQRAAETRLRLVKLASHPAVLRALPGEEEGRPRASTGGRVRVTQAAGPLAAGEGVQGQPRVVRASRTSTPAGARSVRVRRSP